MGDEGLFLRLAGNNLRADNMRRSCNLAVAPMPRRRRRRMRARFHTLSLARARKWKGGDDEAGM